MNQEIAEQFADKPEWLAKVAGISNAMAKEHTDQVRRLSKGQTPSRLWKKMEVIGQKDIAVVYRNDLYTVTARRYDKGWPLNGGPWAVLGIWTNDGNARHDWREFQRIKNDILGPEWEAVELYPQESRLLDPSNYYMLWAHPGRMPFGQNEPRTILGPDNCIAPQRGWAKGDEPPELKK